LAFSGGALVALAAGSFAISVFFPPVVDPLPMRQSVSGAAASAPDERDVHTCGRDVSRPCAPMPLPVHEQAAVTDPIIAAFAVQWDAGSRAAISRIGDRLDWVIVEGAFLGRAGLGELSITLDQDLLADAAARGVAVHLMVTNFARGEFDPQLVEIVVRTPERRANAIAQLVQAVRRYRLRGITIDFERVRPMAHDNVLTFLAELREALAAEQALLSLALPLGEDEGYPLARYGAAVDYLIPMLYDEHAGTSEPGPVASASWYAARLDAVLDTVPADKLLVGLGQYGYHWREDQPEAVTLSVSEAMALGRAAGNGPWLEASSRNPNAEWQDANGIRHHLWYLDAASAWNQLRVASRTGTAGVAIWRLGSEDVTLWRVLGRAGLDSTVGPLEALPDNGVAVIEGDGEVLAIDGKLGTGRRELTLDAQGFVEQERVLSPAGGYVVTRAGMAEREVVLSFDDGPDPEFTAQVLDTLRAYNAVASFFVIGRQVQKLPGLARRMVAEGHEIGNHSWSHPDLAGLSESAIRVELTATGRVIEAVTGRRPMLFRPPYIGDARPSTIERLRPMAVANDLGYRVAGLEVDTRDWFQDDPEAIVTLALKQIDAGKGRIILLHDAGGDRTPTVAALGPLIDSLRARGFTLTTVAGLLDAAPYAGMPAAPPNEAPNRWLNFAALQIAGTVEAVLVAAFLVALVLGFVRLFVIGGLATLQRTRRRYARRLADVRYVPRVSVLVPAYNEARVIGRTVSALLTQEYPDLEVIVIDDGSTDDTFEAARAASTDPRLRVLTQANAGKANALNLGIAEATGDVIVVVDADTLLARLAIQHLVRPLADSRVGAVAGNAKVGNRVNLVTRWQAVEYVTSQNLDRRAFVMLNCITVVPGAIGAWRRSAVLDAGGFRTHTLAEDQDLTLTLLRAGHKVALSERAIAWTEAPETFDALLRQRFRWSFGTLQCAWKHRGALLRPSAGALGLVGLPNIWLFQLLFPLLAPAADIALLATVARLIVETPALGAHAAWVHAEPILALYALFLAIDTLTALIGLSFERSESKLQALLVPLQRVAYRQVLYLALVKAMRAAIKGWAPSWGKLERTGRVKDEAPAEILARPLRGDGPSGSPRPYEGPERRGRDEHAVDSAA
jgi:peptidoglycan-N-acetylglucosamine deacetylase